MLSGMLIAVMGEEEEERGVKREEKIGGCVRVGIRGKMGGCVRVGIRGKGGGKDGKGWRVNWN